MVRCGSGPERITIRSCFLGMHFLFSLLNGPMYFTFSEQFSGCPSFPVRLGEVATSGTQHCLCLLINMRCICVVNHVVLPVSTLSWCVIKADGTLREYTPIRLSDMMPLMPYSLIHFFTVLFSFLTAFIMLGIWKNIFSLNRLPFFAYSILYDGSSSIFFSGNSFLSNSRATPSDAITGSKPWYSKASITGIHRVAWPSPQFKGVTSIFLFCKTVSF